MPDIRFECRGVRADPYAAFPTLAFRLGITGPGTGAVHAVALRCQIRFEPQRRRYAPGEAELLGDLFGEPSRWGETLRPFQFANVPVLVPRYTGATEVDVPVLCSYDLDVAAGKYLASLEDGEIPLLMLFSGTVFARSGEGFTVMPVPWDREARCGLPVAVWRELMDRHFPGCGWLRLRRHTLQALQRYKSGHALATWDEVVEALLKEAR
ncbi:DUF6084 family protein [Sphaerisporangium aureirubrum]|uniref:DUF6084 family protein n=1 Tax=Sphaerisporangium aureirubrum TaxID=1544736 RepID=A0ABW1NLR2_9ACTN